MWAGSFAGMLGDGCDGFVVAAAGGGGSPDGGGRVEELPAEVVPKGGEFMAAPSKATENVAHAAVALAAAIIVPQLIGKGHGRSILAGIAGVVMHMMLDEPLAKTMADHRLQF